MTTILIVDDNKKNLQVLGSVLHENQYRVAMAKDGPSALRLVKKKNPDLIILDIMMPDMDGFEVCERLKEDPETKGIPIIFLTAKTELEDIVQGFTLGGVDYITKPFKREELLVRVQNHVELVNSKKIIEKQASELRAANATKDRIFSVIAHDLRDALGSFKEFANLVTDSRINLSDEDMEEFFIFLKEKASSTFELLENLLWWSRSQRKLLHPKLKQFGISKAVDEAMLIFTEQAEKKRIVIENQIATDSEVIADYDHIQTILKNLISNSIKYSKSDQPVTISLEDRKDSVVVSIKDRGIGIEKENLLNLFDPLNYHSTFGTDGEKGSGIGLVLCKELIDLNRGDISVESTYGDGSLFTFSLPTNI